MPMISERFAEYWRERALMRQLNVRERAQFEAHNGAGPVGFQAQLAAAYAVREERAGRRLLASVNTNRIAAIDAKIGNAAKDFSALTKRTLGELSAASERAWRIKSGAALDEVTEARQKFRNENLISREASYPDDVVRSLVILLVLWTVHIGVNSMCFAAASQLGLLGGVILAAILSLPDITGGLILGFVGLRYRNHIRPERYVFGTIVTVACFVLLAFWTFWVAHMRAALEEGIAAGAAVEIGSIKVLSHMLSQPWAVFQVTDALVLMLISQAAAAIAAWEGYHLADAYPGYTTADRKVVQAKAQIAGANSMVRDEINSISGRAEEDIAARVRDLDKSRAKGEGVIADVDGKVATYLAELTGWQSVCQIVHDTFEDLRHRQCLALGRPTPPAAELRLDSHPTEVRVREARAALRAQIERAVHAAEAASAEIAAAGAAVARDHGLAGIEAGKTADKRLIPQATEKEDA